MGFLYQGHFVSRAFVLGGFLTGGIMVLWLLTEGFLPGLLLLVKCEGNKKNVTECGRREI